MAARITDPVPGYIHGTKYEMPLSFHKRGVGVIPLGKVIVLYDGRKVAVLKRDVPNDIRNDLFHGLDLDKIINEDEPAKHREPECLDDNGCRYFEPHLHGFACDNSCSECHGQCHPDCPAYGKE